MSAFLLSGSRRATCECWGPVGPVKVHKEEHDAQEKEEKCVHDKGKAGQEGSK